MFKSPTKSRPLTPWTQTHKHNREAGETETQRGIVIFPEWVLFWLRTLIPKVFSELMRYQTEQQTLKIQRDEKADLGDRGRPDALSHDQPRNLHGPMKSHHVGPLVQKGSGFGDDVSRD